MNGGLSEPMLAAMKAPEKGDPPWLFGVGGPGCEPEPSTPESDFCCGYGGVPLLAIEEGGSGIGAGLPRLPLPGAELVGGLSV